MRSTGRTTAVLAAMACASVGAGAGIAGSLAAPAKKGARTSRAAPRQGWRDAHRDGPGRGPVHAELLVPSRDGTKFITVTEDNGALESADGSTLTLTEGTGTLTREATVTVPDGATVVRDGKKATLSDLQAGDRVHAVLSADRNVVLAASAGWRPPGRPGRRRHDGFDGPPMGPGPGGPAGSAPDGSGR